MSDAQPVGPARHLDFEELLGGQRRRELGVDAREVVAAIHQRARARCSGASQRASRCRGAGSRSMHSLPTTSSPSISRLMRNTPCVDGCCGPMLRMRRSVCSSSTPVGARCRPAGRSTGCTALGASMPSWSGRLPRLGAGGARRKRARRLVRALRDDHLALAVTHLVLGAHRRTDLQQEAAAQPSVVSSRLGLG